MCRISLYKILTYSILITLLSCHGPIFHTKESIKFKTVNINISENGVLNIQDCAKWYIDFNSIKKTLIYKDKIICVGLSGGIACLNSSNLRQDTVLEKKLNTDFFTDVSIYEDTLFAEKFNSLYYWNSEKWIECSSQKPIKYFDLLFENKQYVFYSSCMGEFGSILFVYNKTTNITRGELTSCPNSIIQTDSAYYVGTHLYHMMGSSNLHLIKNIEKLKIIPDSIRFYQGMFDRDPRLEFLQDTSVEIKNNYSTLNFFYPKDIMVVASFNNSGKLFHIIDPRDYTQTNEKRLIGTVENDTLKIIDSLQNCYPRTAVQFGNSTIINENSNGFTLIRNDSIFKITFTTKHTNYQGPKFEDYNFTTDSSKKLTAYKEYTYNDYDEETLTQKPGQPEREISFQVNNNLRIEGYYGNGQDGNYIYKDGVKFKLKFRDEESFLKTIFTYDNRLFLFFGNLGNYKIGLIEITDINKFTKIYKE